MTSNMSANMGDTHNLTLARSLCPYRTISIIGMAKNVGKTTTLNYLIEVFNREKTSLGLTSIGRDGERVDVVTKTKKPEIFVFKGTIIATAEQLLPLCDITKEILMLTDFNTPLGRIVLVRALSDGFVQLGGPSITTQVSDLIKHIPSDKVIVDGAINRKSLASPDVTDATVLCTGAGLNRSMNTVIEETHHAVQMLMLPKFEAALLHTGFLANGALDEKITIQQGCIYVRGAVSDSLALEIIMSNPDLKGTYIVADDPSKLFIKPATYEKLRLKKAILAVKATINLVGLTINPVSPYHDGFHPGEFLEKMQEAVPVPVYNVLCS